MVIKNKTRHKSSMEIVGKIARDTRSKKIQWYYEDDSQDYIEKYYSSVPITEEKSLIFFFYYDIEEPMDSYLGIFFDRKGKEAVTVRMINDFKNFNILKKMILNYGLF